MWSVIWLLLMSRVCGSLLRSCYSAGPHLQLLDCLGLLHQDWELYDPQRYGESAKLMLQPALILLKSTFLYDRGRVESCQVLKPVCVCLYNQVPLLEHEEFNFPPCLALLGKYFSKNLVLKVVQVTSSTRVCISCNIHTY